MGGHRRGGAGSSRTECRPLARDGNHARHGLKDRPGWNRPQMVEGRGRREVAPPADRHVWSLRRAVPGPISVFV